MVFLWHLIYAVVFVIYFFAATSTYPETKEDIREASYGKQFYLRLIPFIIMGLIYLFPLIDSSVQTNSMESFINRFTLEFITATVANMIIFLNCTEFATKRAEKLKWFPYAAFIVYTLIKNVKTHNNIFMIILAEAWGLVVLAAFAFLAFIFKDTFTVPTRAEKAEADAKWEAEHKKLEEENRKQREYEAWKASLYPNSSKNTSNNSYTSKSSSSSSSYSSSGRKGFFEALAEEQEEKKTLGFERDGKQCHNCRYFDGDVCTCQYSGSYNKSIYNPHSSSCGYHRD